MVEEDDALGARDGGEQQARHGRVVGRAHRGVVVPVDARVGRCVGGVGAGGGGQEARERIGGEREIGLVAARVAERDGRRGAAEVALWAAVGGRLDVVVGTGAVGGRGVEVESGGYGAGVVGRCAFGGGGCGCGCGVEVRGGGGGIARRTGVVVVQSWKGGRRGGEGRHCGCAVLSRWCVAQVVDNLGLVMARKV